MQLFTETGKMFSLTLKTRDRISIDEHGFKHWVISYKLLPESIELIKSEYLTGLTVFVGDKVRNYKILPEATVKIRNTVMEFF